MSRAAALLNDDGGRAGEVTALERAAAWTDFGFELNVLGLSFGVNPFSPAIRLPMLGRIGPGRTDIGSKALRPKPGGPPES